MGSIWKCSAGALQGLHGHQPVLGFGEAHDVKNSSHHTLDRRFGLCFGSRVSRRTIPSRIPQFEGVTGQNSVFIPGCWSMGWSQRFPFMTTTTHAYDNINSPKSTRLDNSEEDTEFAEKSRRATAFQDFGTDGDEPFGNGDYRRLSRDDDVDDSKASNLFREERDDDGVWADSVARDDEHADDGDEVTSSDGYGSWDIPNGTGSSSSVGSAADSLAIGGKEPVYQVLEVHPGGDVVQREVSRRQLLRSIAGLRLRDIRSVDPSLWVTNSVPAILVRDQAILLNLGSLRAIATSQSVLIFEHKSIGAEAFMGALLPRLRTANNSNSPIMPFELEVVEAALISRTQRLERMLMDVEPRVMASLKVLPIRYTGDVLEELRLGKQALVELAAKAGALRQMLLEMLEHPEDIRKMTIMGRTCKVRRKDGSIECTIPLDKQTAEDEEEEIEMLLEYYLQRCDSCHGQAEKLLDAAKEMEDSIGVNLSSRRLEVSRLELLLQVATFCSALGALVAGIFGMNLKSYLEERALAFYITTGGIVFGGIALYLIMFKYLKARKIL